MSAQGRGRPAQKSTGNKSSGSSTKSTKAVGKSADTRPKQTNAARGHNSSSKAVVPRGSRTVAHAGGGKGASQSMIVPEGYTMRKVEPAKNYDVVSFARAMNPDFGPRVQQLFEPEKEAAIEAQRTGIYIGWRCPEFKHDCQRVSSRSKCFCGHLLTEHDKYSGRSIRVPCKQAACKCKAFAWIPARPEEIGEFWFQRRRDFDPAAWRAKCRCKHNHEEHMPFDLRRCKMRGCGCGAFDSNFLCAACDRHWEHHETVFETVSDRQQNGLPVGGDYLPFSEIPSLRNMVLTGEDDGDMSYIALTDGKDPLPLNAPSDNSTVVPYRGAKPSGFRPVYD